jgi:hypothetical protein
MANLNENMMPLADLMNLQMQHWTGRGGSIPADPFCTAMRKERRNEDHKHTTKANHIGSLSPAGETLPACCSHVRRTARRGDVP